MTRRHRSRKSERRGRGIEISEYDPAWPGLAEPENALPSVFAAIEHIGSTAVPGLAAKPVIDLMAAAEDLGAVERNQNAMTDRLLYVRARGGLRTRIVTNDSWPTRRYADLKRAIVAAESAPTGTPRRRRS
ncbi:GrpB family protein [Amycolatopsis sp. NPDC057786]|uniref:GrpB family protein n=1 Tax=Amycolatopsis sp. NPDC057786 TaxID=3346250 RepID=UPI00366F37EE